MGPDEYKAKIDKFNWGDLDARWQTDEDLYLMEPYQWPTTEGKIIKSRDYVTLNAARYFADRVIDTVKFAKEQITIEEGVDQVKMPDSKATPIEKFIRANMELAEERLQRAEILPNREAAAGHLVVRGRAIRRVLVMEQGGKYIPDIQWYDPRYVKYSAGKDGFRWVCTTEYKDADEIEEVYGKKISGDEGKVETLWDKDYQYVWVDAEKLTPWNHKLPFVGQIVPVGGFILTNGKYKQTIGESVMGPVRNMYPVLNKLLTILMTYTRLSIEGAYQYESDDPEGEREQVRKNKYPIEPGKVTVVKRGGGYKLIPVGDIKAATQYLLSQYEVSVQRATLPFLDYGQTPFELSGSAMLMIKGAGDIIYVPRMMAMSNLNKNTYWMLIKQYREGGIPYDLAGSLYTYDMAKCKLDGNYTLNVRNLPNLPEKDLAQLHLAAAKKELGVSLDTILRDDLQIDDPDGEVAKIFMEKTRMMIPELEMREAVHGYLNRDDETAVEIILDKLDISFEQLMSGEVAGAKPIQPQEQRQPSAFIAQREQVKQSGAIRYAEPPKNQEVMVG